MATSSRVLFPVRAFRPLKIPGSVEHLRYSKIPRGVCSVCLWSAAIQAAAGACACAQRTGERDVCAQRTQEKGSCVQRTQAEAPPTHANTNGFSFLASAFSRNNGLSGKQSVAETVFTVTEARTARKRGPQHAQRARACACCRGTVARAARPHTTGVCGASLYIYMCCLSE